MIKSILGFILQLYIKYVENAMLPAGIRFIFKLIGKLVSASLKVLYCFALVSAEMLQSKFALETNICSLCVFFFFYKTCKCAICLMRMKQELFSHKNESLQ